MTKESSHVFSLAIPSSIFQVLEAVFIFYSADILRLLMERRALFMLKKIIL